jgi:hypothetical protein
MKCRAEHSIILNQQEDFLMLIVLPEIMYGIAILMIRFIPIRIIAAARKKVENGLLNMEKLNGGLTTVNVNSRFLFITFWFLFK